MCGVCAQVKQQERGQIAEGAWQKARQLVVWQLQLQSHKHIPSLAYPCCNPALPVPSGVLRFVARCVATGWECLDDPPLRVARNPVNALAGGQVSPAGLIRPAVTVRGSIPGLQRAVRRCSVGTCYNDRTVLQAPRRRAGRLRAFGQACDVCRCASVCLFLVRGLPLAGDQFFLRWWAWLENDPVEI